MFNTHITEKIGKASKGIGCLTNHLKSFARPYLDYGDIVYDRPDNESFISKL